ncbi:MAG: outer membrane protein transport protein [Halieaceae bacterium]
MNKLISNNYLRSALSGTLSVFLAAPALFLAAPALAGGPAFTGIIAEANSAESAFAAPAGMSRLSGTRITVQGLAALPQAKFDVDENKTTVDGGDPDKGEDPIIIPSLYYVRQLNDKWHAGFSLTVPSGFGSNYGSEWAGRYQTVDYSLVYVALTPAVAYRVNDKLSLGVGVGINYTAEDSETKLRQPLGETDGKISSDLDGVGVNVTLSALYEFNQHTRAGIAWTSDSDADLEGNIKLRKLGPVLDPILTEKGLKNINTELTNTLPQRVVAGIYHEFASGNFFTVDAMWMKFSDFTISDIKLEGEDVNVSAPEIYDDIGALTIGAGFPVNDRLTYRVGAMYLSSIVDDDDRTLSMRMDAMWGVGVGAEYQLGENRSVDVNANFMNVGEAPVDVDGSNGRVVGESNDPYAFLFELSYHF